MSSDRIHTVPLVDSVPGLPGAGKTVDLADISKLCMQDIIAMKRRTERNLSSSAETWTASLLWIFLMCLVLPLRRVGEEWKASPSTSMYTASAIGKQEEDQGRDFAFFFFFLCRRPFLSDSYFFRIETFTLFFLKFCSILLA